MTRFMRAVGVASDRICRDADSSERLDERGANYTGFVTSRSERLEVAIFVSALVAVVASWAVNGFEGDWLYLYAVLATLVIPVSWFLRKKAKGSRG